MDSSQKQTEEWYKKYYEAKGKDRNDLLTNPGVLYQLLAFEASVVSALRRASLDRESSTILDVGCGGGNSIARFLEYGFAPRNLRGIDIIPARIEEAKARYPNLDFLCHDATAMPYESGTFDLVLES